MTRIYKVDNIQFEDTYIIYHALKQNIKYFCRVSDVMRGDRNRIELQVIDDPERIAILPQLDIDCGRCILYEVKRETNPEYFL